MDCIYASDIIVNSAFKTWPHDINEDFGVIVLSGDLEGETSTMDMSTVGPSTWDNFWSRTVGYPGFVVGSSPPSCAGAVFPAAEGVMSARKAFRQARDELMYTTGKIKTRFDWALGQSGSPVFYCPSSEDCDSNPKLYGVMTMWNSGSDKWEGPRVDIFESFVNANRP